VTDGRGDDRDTTSGAGPEAPARPKSYRHILADEVAQGLTELERPAHGLALSGLSAGLDIGFSVLLMATFLTVAGPDASDLVREAGRSALYSVGFILVILGRSELFTEHTTLAAFPVLAGRAPLRRLGRLWGIVYAANVVGASAFALLAAWLGPALGICAPGAFEEIALPLVDLAALPMFLSAVLAGWLMGLLSWLLSAAQDSTSRILVTAIVASAIGFLGLHHCIVGTVEVLAAAFAGTSVGAGDFARFLLWATTGNVVGGVVFVALIKYGHSTRAGPEARPEPVHRE
jgi:formate/nitrite transporter FocA (FNT family)